MDSTSYSRPKPTLLVLAILFPHLCSPVSADLIISINSGANLSTNPLALAAFDRAASRWERYFGDDITVNIAADIQDSSFFGGNTNIIGSASSVLVPESYDTYRNALIADSATEFDDGIVGALPTAANVDFDIPATASYSGDLLANKATAKALGFTGLDATFGATDATITFNSDFAFDYDNSDGVGAGLTDFETVAAHEIGHALGFVSSVDFLDQNPGINVSPTLLDLYRFETGSAEDPDTLADFSTAQRSLRPGIASHFDDIDNEWAFSTGFFNGDGRQASHWKDNDLAGNFIGMFDPTLAPGQAFPITFADVRSLDLIGFDFIPSTAAVPEPSSVAIMFVLAAAFAFRRQRSAQS